jgi:beta-glucanase (GH16 family)
MHSSVARFKVAASRMVLICGIAAISLALAASPAPKPTAAPALAPTIVTTPAQNGAVIVALASQTSHATIYYTVDGTTPTTSSQIYEAPFLVAGNLTVKAIALSPGSSISVATSRTFALNIPVGTLVWSDEFSNTTGAGAQPDPRVWSYNVGNKGSGNNELETYCAWSSSVAPCSASKPNVYVGTDGYLHIIARQPSAGVYTSARLKSSGLFSLRYGRVEFRAKLPEAQGLWPAAWLLGNNAATIHWPACGEMDVLERVNAARKPDWNEGSVHGQGFIGDRLGARFYFPGGQTAAEWHTYGMIWKKKSIAYYVDDPARPYVTYTPASLAGMDGATWPFDAGQSAFLILNLAVGGDWPGPPNATTPFPAEMLVDYVRVYTD